MSKHTPGQEPILTLGEMAKALAQGKACYACTNCQEAASWALSGWDKHGSHIVACVHALEGIEDPEETVREMREALEAFTRSFLSGTPEDLGAAFRQARAVLAKLQPKEER